MSSSVESPAGRGRPANLLCRFSKATFPSVNRNTNTVPAPSNVFLPLQLPPLPTFESPSRTEPAPSKSSAPLEGHGASESRTGFPSSVSIGGLNSNGKVGGPAFVGQVFSMCDLSGTDFIAVSTHFDIPFLSKRTPEWLKKLFASVTKSERKGPVFRFFMDLGDAVNYVKRLNIPSGMVGACPLYLAYDHFKEKPHLFQFVPNEKQVKAANKLLKTMPQGGGSKKVDGLPVFSSQNLDIAIATSDGIKWYTPYFFDKSMLDNILEESVDQHFDSMIETRHAQRRKDVIDDNLPAEAVDDTADSLWDPPEVQEVMDELGHPGIPLSVISKAAEMQLLYAVDRVMLGNRWLRKMTGIQPKFPYVVDSFEKRSLVSSMRASKPTTNSLADSASSSDSQGSTTEHELKNNNQDEESDRFQNGVWSGHPWLQEHDTIYSEGSPTRSEMLSNPFLPKVTMVGISTGEEAGQMNKITQSNLKKTMEDLTKDLKSFDDEVPEDGETSNGCVGVYEEHKVAERDPLFVANVDDYYAGLSKPGSSRMVCGRNDD